MSKNETVPLSACSKEEGTNEWKQVSSFGIMGLMFSNKP